MNENDRPEASATEPRTDHTTRYLYQCPGCWSYGLWAIPIGGGRSKTDEGWIECDCGEKMTRIDLRRQEPSPFAEAAQGTDGAAQEHRWRRFTCTCGHLRPEALPEGAQGTAPPAALRVEYNTGRTHGYAEGFRAAQGAAPRGETRAEGLDVRMDWPCSSTREAPGWCVPHDSHWMIENPTCARMRINARLSRPSEERVPESEEPR